MRFPALVMQCEAFLQCAAHGINIDFTSITNVGSRSLERGEGSARIAVTFARKYRPRVIRNCDTARPESALDVGEGAVDHCGEIAFSQRFQHEYAHPRQERSIHLERWIFSGRTDQRD